jgi:hypothetical protein
MGDEARYSTFIAALKRNPRARAKLKRRTQTRYLAGELPTGMVWLADEPDLLAALLVDFYQEGPSAKNGASEPENPSN